MSSTECILLQLLFCYHGLSATMFRPLPGYQGSHQVFHAGIQAGMVAHATEFR